MPILKRILVATDLSAAGYRAVMRAGQLARQWEARLYLVHARPDWNLFARWLPASQDSYHDVAQSSDRPLRQILTELEATFDVHAQCDSRFGRASNVVAAMVAACEPHLVVTGARGEHEWCRVSPCLGGTALKLLTRVEQPLLIVRDTTTDAYTRSLVAVDTAGALSRRAVLWGSGLVQGGDCHVVHAYDVPYVERMRLGRVTEAVLDAWMRQAHDAAKTTVNEVLAAAEGPARLHAHAVRGESASAVLVEIARHAPQVVMIGKRHSPVPHGSMGSVGFAIAYQAPADVLIISS